MFDEAYKKLDLDEISIILESINNRVDGSIFDPLETTILATDVSFYPNYRFLDISDHATYPPLQRYAFQKKEKKEDDEEFIILNWTYKTIYDLNLKSPIRLDDKNVLDYVRFFFQHVKGRHGRFIICESADHVNWRDDPPSEIRKSLGQMLQPLKIIEKRKDGVYHVEGYMMLKDAVFKVDIYVEQNGRITMADHKILLEDIPVMDSMLGQ